MISNHPTPSGIPGRIDGLRCLESSGEISGVDVISAGRRDGEPQSEHDARVGREVRRSKADVLVALSLKDHVRDVSSIGKAIAGRPLLYWEGDPWGRGKAIPEEMKAWLEFSDIAFSVGGPPQAQMLLAAGARIVCHTIHTYDHVQFKRSERGDQPSPSHMVAFLGTNASKAPLVSGLPGSFRRWQLVAAMARAYPGQFLFAGPGWPARLGQGAVPFGEQDRFIQRARLLVNWDHFPKIAAYTSDRMAICMIAGRPQVSTLHPQMAWMPEAEIGLYLEGSVGRVIERTHDLLSRPATDLADAGRAAHEWARPGCPIGRRCATSCPPPFLRFTLPQRTLGPSSQGPG